MMKVIKFSVLTVSDSCYKNENIDQSGPKIISLIKSQFLSSVIVNEDVVPDEFDMIKEKLTAWSDEGCDVILTTGGTGLAPRDVTPEATKSVIDKEVPGIAHAMMSKSLSVTPFAMLSRAVSGIRNKTLIINFPGSVKAVTENFAVVSEIIPHAVCLIQDDVNIVKETHKNIPNDFDNNLSASRVKLNSVAKRPRVSEYKMVEVYVAHQIITSVCVQDSDTESLNIADSLGHVLAEDVRSIDPLPPFPASTKDGYAVISDDGAGKRIVIDVVAAGDNPDVEELKRGQCVRISTGAPVPPGADAVVQVEDTKMLLATEDSSKELEINILVAPKLGQDIREAGSDIEAHSIVLKKGTVLNAAEIGVLAAVGRRSVKIFKRLIVGVISTGNEVQDHSEPLQHGRIRDSNKITLLSILKQYSYIGLDCGVARDDPTAVKDTLAKAFEKCDMVITTGGVSMGEYDVLKQVLLQDYNAKIHFGRVNMKPGKPTTFATCMYKNKIKMIFGLPGNPVSATVTCLLFVIPALRHCENRTNIFYPKIWVECDFPPVPDMERPEYQRVMLNYKSDSRVSAATTGNQISSRLNSFVNADGLMLVPAVKAGGIQFAPPVSESQPEDVATAAAPPAAAEVPNFGSASFFGSTANQFQLNPQSSFDTMSATLPAATAAFKPASQSSNTFGSGSKNSSHLRNLSTKINFSPTSASGGSKQKYLCYVLNRY